MKSTLTQTVHFPASIFALLVFMAALSGQSHAQPIWASDGAFNLPDWNCLVVASMSGAGATAPCYKDLPGNPGPSRRTQHIYGSGNPPAVIVAHLYQPLSSFYNPAVQGAIVGLNYSYDLKLYSGGNVAYCMLVFQNNKYYRSGTVDNINSLNWTSFSHSNLTAANFVDVTDPTDSKHPDFSCKGSVIQFGYRTGNSNTGTTDSAIDNWKVNILSGDTCCLKRMNQSIQCGPGTGYTYTVTLKNQTGFSMQQIFVKPTLPTGVTLNSQTFPVTLPINGLTTLQVIITGAPPGSNVCLRFTRGGLDAPCCSTDLCFVVPKQGQC